MFKQIRKLKANATFRDKLKIPFQAPQEVDLLPDRKFNHRDSLFASVNG